jgi:hypothetical protein
MTVLSEGNRIRRVANWTFRNRQTGAITVAQWPNAPLVIFGVVTVALRSFHPSGGIGTAGRVVAGLALLVWALDEVTRGVNPFRRMLGVVVLGAVIAGLALR